MSCVKLDRNDGMTSSNDAYENKSMSIAILGRDSNSIFHTDFPLDERRELCVLRRRKVINIGSFSLVALN